MKVVSRFNLFSKDSVSGNIYISNLAAASNPNTLSKHSIKAVITTAKGLLLPYSKEQLPNYLYLPIQDTEEQSIGRFFPTVFDFMEKNRSRTNVLVHCYSGISRSAAFIMAYLMRKYGYRVSQSLLLLKGRKRRVHSYAKQIKPNSSFVRQLQKYQLELQEQRNHRLKIPISNEKDCGKKQQLATQLNAIKACSLHLQTKISQAKKNLRQLTQKKIQFRVSQTATSGKKSQQQPRQSQFCERRYFKKGQLNFQMLKGTISALRSSVSQFNNYSFDITWLFPRQEESIDP